MGARMRAHDWTASPLGRPETWPQSLRTVVSLLLSSKFPMFVAWGPDLVFLYNDGYVPILGAKHPSALGRRFKEIWFEIWDDISPLVERALQGEATFHEDLPLTMLRKGFEERTYFTFSYSPVRDESGGMAGMFCACTETTGQVLAKDALRKSEEQLRALADNLPYGMVYQMAMQRDGSERRFTFVSQSSERLSGVRPEAALRDPGVLYATIMPEYHAALAVAEEVSIRDAKPMDIEVAFRRADGTQGWCRIVSAPRLMTDGTYLWDGLQIDITERKRMEEHQTLLINELNHRVKNTLATVQSIAAQTLRNTSSSEQAREAFESRLMALSRAHDVLTRENWEGAGLREIVAQAVEAYANRAESRLHLSGGDVRLPPRMALALAMAMQELATNAAKYGALSNASGEVEIAWKVERKADRPHLRLRWEERGGPPVAPPQRRGFGSRLIERSLAQDLGGEARIDFATTGVVCTVDAPLA